MELYTSDLTNAEWVILEPLIPPEKPGGRPREVNMRAVLNGIFYVLRAGCAWRMIPHDYPPKSTVYAYFARFRNEGVWEQIMASLWERCRQDAGREAAPSAGIIDSQSIRSTDRGGPHGYDGGKKLSGRKRHIFVDTTGLLLNVVVHTADIQDRQGVPFLLDPIKGRFPHMKKVWADQGYTGKGREWIKEHMGWEVEIVLHSWPARGEWVPHGNLSDVSIVCFIYEHIKPEPKKFRGVLPRHWVVERMFAWIGRYRRMSKDYKYVTRRSENIVYVTHDPIDGQKACWDS